MREMRVSRYAVYFNAQFLEFCIVVSQVTQLCRADEREIGWIKEHYRPLAFQVRIADFNEFTIMESCGFKRFYFRIDQWHVITPFSFRVCKMAVSKNDAKHNACWRFGKMKYLLAIDRYYKWLASQPAARVQIEADN